MHAARYWAACDVLVRAAGGTGKLNWHQILGGRKTKGTTPVLVIDIADGHGRARADADVRRAEYREQGLEVLESEQADRVT